MVRRRLEWFEEFSRIIPNFDILPSSLQLQNVSVLYQMRDVLENPSMAAERFPDIREKSRGSREISRPEMMDFPWYLPIFGGVQTLSHQQYCQRELNWISVFNQINPSLLRMLRAVSAANCVRHFLALINSSHLVSRGSRRKGTIQWHFLLLHKPTNIIKIFNIAAMIQT